MVVVSVVDMWICVYFNTVTTFLFLYPVENNVGGVDYFFQTFYFYYLSRSYPLCYTTGYPRDIQY